MGDLTIPRQLLELRDETLKSGATPRRGVLLPLIDAARAGRKTRDETLGDLSIARFPSREDTMSADEASAVLDHARAVVDAEHALLLESRLGGARRRLISAFRARADARGGSLSRIKSAARRAAAAARAEL